MPVPFDKTRPPWRKVQPNVATGVKFPRPPSFRRWLLQDAQGDIARVLQHIVRQHCRPRHYACFPEYGSLLSVHAEHFITVHGLPEETMDEALRIVWQEWQVFLRTQP